MTDYEDFKPFFDAMIAEMKRHDFVKGDSWKAEGDRMHEHLKGLLFKNVNSYKYFAGVKDNVQQEKLVDIANMCATLYLRGRG